MNDSGETYIPEVKVLPYFLWICPTCGSKIAVPEEEILISSDECMACGQAVTLTGFAPKIKLFSKKAQKLDY